MYRYFNVFIGASLSKPHTSEFACTLSSMGKQPFNFYYLSTNYDCSKSIYVNSTELTSVAVALFPSAIHAQQARLLIDGKDGRAKCKMC